MQNQGGQESDSRSRSRTPAVEEKKRKETERQDRHNGVYTKRKRIIKKKQHPFHKK